MSQTKSEALTHTETVTSIDYTEVLQKYYNFRVINRYTLYSVILSRQSWMMTKNHPFSAFFVDILFHTKQKKGSHKFLLYKGNNVTWNLKLLERR